MDLALLAARLILTVVLTVATAAKLGDRAHSRSAVAEFGVPARLVRPLAWALPLTELAIAATLVPKAWRSMHPMRRRRLRRWMLRELLLLQQRGRVPAGGRLRQLQLSATAHTGM